MTRVIIVVLCALALPSVVWAQPCPSVPAGTTAIDAAKTHVARGREQFDAERFSDAAKAFACADAASPSAIVKQNEGAAWARADDRVRAADAFEEALARGTLDAAWIADTRSRLAPLRAALGVVVIEQPVGAKVTVGHIQRRAIPIRFHLEPGTHVVVVEGASGQRVERKVTVAANQVVTPQFSLPAPEPEVQPTEPPAPRAPSAPASDDVHLGFGIGLTALGGALGVAAIATAVHFVNLREDYLAEQTDRAAFDQTKDFQAASSVLIYAAIGVTALGVVVLATVPGDDVEVSIVVSPTGAALRGRF